MNTDLMDTEQKLISFASSLGSDPLSWVGWSCVHLDLSNLDDEIKPECLFWIDSVVSFYFANVENHIYVCHGENIHIICKTTNLDILHQAAQQVSDLAYNETKIEIPSHIYNLTRDAHDYVQTVLDQAADRHIVPDIEVRDVPYAQGAFAETETPKSQELSYKVKVLLVEDDPATRWLVRNALKQDCEFMTAPTANKAFALYGSYQPDIVFLDIGLPDKSGHDVLKWIMRNDPGACVVMFSGSDNLDNITSTLEDGATGFIKKPFLTESLMHYIHNHVG